jgi:hypothetical protein
VAYLSQGCCAYLSQGRHGEKLMHQTVLPPSNLGVYTRSYSQAIGLREPHCKNRTARTALQELPPIEKKNQEKNKTRAREGVTPPFRILYSLAENKHTQAKDNGKINTIRPRAMGRNNWKRQ